MHYMQRQTGPYSRLSTQFLRDTWQLLRVHDGLRALPELLHCRYYETDWLSNRPILLIDGEYDRMAVKALPAGLSNVTHLQLSTRPFPSPRRSTKLAGFNPYIFYAAIHLNRLPVFWMIKINQSKVPACNKKTGLWNSNFFI